MLNSGESQKEVIRPDFNRTFMIDFHGATITSDVGFLLMREIDDRFKIIAPMGDCLEDLRCQTYKTLPGADDSSKSLSDSSGL